MRLSQYDLIAVGILKTEPPYARAGAEQIILNVVDRDSFFAELFVGCVHVRGFKLQGYSAGFCVFEARGARKCDCGSTFG